MGKNVSIEVGVSGKTSKTGDEVMEALPDPYPAYILFEGNPKISI